MRLVILAVGILLEIAAPLFAQPIENYRPHVLIEATWGSSDNQFAYKMMEGEPEYPHVFEVDDHEQIYVLDEFNNRVEHYDENGKFLQAIPILAYSPATAEQYKRLPLATRSTWIGDLRFFNGTLCAVQELYSGKLGQGPSLNVLQLQDNAFVQVGTSSRTAILDAISYGFKRRIARAKAILGHDPLLAISTQLANGPHGKHAIENVTYGGIPIGEVIIDRDNNRWILNRLKGEVNRKYSPDGRLLFEILGGDVTPVVSPEGNYFTLELYPTRPNTSELLTLDRSRGIRITKYSKN